ncbi:hypothetical protein ANO14919_071110 [Xylariales sp. No.14919]|nr:hypothetical protein ANO14919_071110 [Xylariales sp. No.14919]
MRTLCDFLIKAFTHLRPFPSFPRIVSDAAEFRQIYRWDLKENENVQLVSGGAITIIDENTPGFAFPFPLAFDSTTSRHSDTSPHVPEP